MTNRRFLHCFVAIVWIGFGSAVLAQSNAYRIHFSADPAESQYELATQIARQYGGTVEPSAGIGDGVVMQLDAASARTLAMDARVSGVVAANSGAGLSWTFGEYQYDGSGNIKSIGTQVRSSGVMVSEAIDRYAYDVVGRLRHATAAGGSRTEHYSYDPFGNISEIETHALGNVVEIRPAVNSSTNRMNGSTGNYNAWSAYDDAGNETSYLDRPRTIYDALGEVVAYRGIELYIYNTAGERIGKSPMSFDKSGSVWTYTFRDEAGRVLREVSYDVDRSPAWTWSRDYVHAGDALLASVSNDGAGGEAVRHYHRDHLGTPRMITDATGYRVARDDYYPFGVDVTYNPNDPERLHFTGHERDYHGSSTDPNTDYLDYMHARYYRPVTGRFLSVDPDGWDLRRPQSWNRYSYVLNNPILHTDPTGRCLWDICVGEATAAVVVLTTATAYVLAPSSVPGKSNGQVMAESAVDGVKAVGRLLLNGSAGRGSEMAAERMVENWAKKEGAQQDSTQNTNGTLPKPPTGPGSVQPPDRDPKRVWTPKEREAKRNAQGGQCANGCGTALDGSNSRGHHVQRHADGGKTNDANHAEVCVDCHKQLHSPPL